VVERAVSAFCGEAPTLTAAGRTDAGVHALGQVAHLDLARTVETNTLRDALNAHLRPHPVAVLEAEHVPSDFHARFSATARHYRFQILNRRAPPTLERGRVWHVPQSLDTEAMHAAAQALVGHHDFTTFRSTECQARSPEKTLDRLTVLRAGECIVIEASARSFLHNQVRSMVGSLKLVGLGKWGRRDLEKALAARDRTACGPVAPPEGLFLVRVDYPSFK
jgi:tRNA pseudouridine38-40 synthase